MAEPALLSPEIEGLLRELAADPRSELLRVPRPARIVPFLEGDCAIGADDSSLRSLERHLLRVHRDELAALLLLACEHALLKWPQPPYHVVRFQSPRRLRDPLVEDEWSADMRHAVGFADVSAADVLLRMIHLPSSSWPSVSELASLSHKIVPGDRARIFAGIGLVYAGRPRTALRLLTEVAVRRRGHLSAYAWSNIGLAYVALDDREAAVGANRLATLLGERSGIAGMHWLYNALLVGCADAVREAVAWVDAEVPSDGPVLQDYVASQKPRRQRDALPELHDARAFVRRHSERWGASSRRVASVLED
jgi:hypothetical protein